MSEHHYIEKCKCGFVIRQCRCAGEKTIRIVPCDHAQTPPPRQEGMTASRYSWNPRGMVEHPEGVYMRFDDHVLATQRETITRLEGDMKAACGELLVSLDDAPPGSLVAKLVLANRVLRSKNASLQARLTASEQLAQERVKCMADQSRIVRELSAAQKWTPDRPTVAGWYWYRSIGDPADIVQVYESADGAWMIVGVNVRWMSMDVFYEQRDEFGELLREDIEFQGPLTPGKE